MIIFLENVPNLESHDGGNTYQIIKQSIEREGYKFWSETLSPHAFGTPQIRKRLYMVAIRNELCNDGEFNFPTGLVKKTNVKAILDKKNSISDKYLLSNEDIKILDHWNYFIQNIDPNITPSSPTWSQEYGRSYPLEDIHPIVRHWRVTVRQLKVILENEGISPAESRFRSKVIEQFPPYIMKSKRPLPEWKKKIILNNRKKWSQVSDDLGEEWLMKVRTFEETYQKFEWQVGDGEGYMETYDSISTIWNSCKRNNYIPALVAIAQIPIIGWQNGE